MTRGRSHCGGWIEVPRGEELVVEKKILSPPFSLSVPPPSAPYPSIPPPLFFPCSLWWCRPGIPFLSSSVSIGLFQWKLGEKIQRQPGKKTLQPGKPTQRAIQKQCLSADRDGCRTQWRDRKYQNLMSDVGGGLRASDGGQLQLGIPGGCFSGLPTAAPCMHAFHLCLALSTTSLHIRKTHTHAQKAICRCLPTAWGSTWWISCLSTGSHQEGDSKEELPMRMLSSFLTFTLA